MAPKRNPKKQRSGQQHRTTTTPTPTPQSTTSPYANSSKSQSPCPPETTLQLDPVTSQPEPVREDPSIEARLVEDDKLARVWALHARWKYEDNEEQALEGESLQAR